MQVGSQKESQEIVFLNFLFNKIKWVLKDFQ
jgi:hypothetical protein